MYDPIMLYLLNIIQISTEISFDVTVQGVHIPYL